MNNKEKAVLGAGVLVLVFIGFAVWFMFTHPAPSTTASSVPSIPAATTTSATQPAAVAGTPQAITEHAKYYTIDLSYPSQVALAGTASVQASPDAVATMRGYLETEITQFKENNNFANLSASDIQTMGLDQHKYTLTAQYKSYQGDGTVSYVFTLAQDTGGAHPIPYFRTFTFDSQTGKVLTLANLFVPSANYLQTLSTIVRADLPAIIKAQQPTAYSPDSITVGTNPQASNYGSWYLSGSNLVIIFGAYQVGPYSLGIVRDPIPLTKLSNILEPAYGGK